MYRNTPLNWFFSAGFLLAFLPQAAHSALIITEFMRNPSGSDALGEWFEVYNAGSTPVDLYQWSIADLGSNSHTIGSSVVVGPSSYALLGRNGDTATNGGLVFDYVYGNQFVLANGDDELLLFDDLGTEIDRVVYDSSFPGGDGVSAMLVSLGLDNNDPANWVAATTYYNADNKGTPGAPNFSAAATVAEPPASALLLLGGVLALMGNWGRRAGSQSGLG
ncbi:MAG TPA: lamin tail domain-containing protein [Gammaproteobacteria bacterium]|nr:lamin tail domain-containing protein [Gammaproteobacteria bacterium]